MPNEFAEAGDLLKSDALRGVDTELAKRRNLPLVDGNPVVSLNLAMRQMGWAKLTASDVRRLLESDGDLIVRLALAYSQLKPFNPDADEGEHARGEEQDPAGRATLDGIAVGAGIIWAIHLHFLRDRTPADLRAYLKAKKTYKASQFIKDLTRAYATLE